MRQIVFCHRPIFTGEVAYGVDVPEPTSVALLIGGLLGLSSMRPQSLAIVFRHVCS